MKLAILLVAVSMAQSIHALTIEKKDAGYALHGVVSKITEADSNPVLSPLSVTTKAPMHTVCAH